MNKEFLLEIVTPEKQIYGGLVEEIICQTEVGEIAILKGHIPMLTTLVKGTLKFKENTEWKNLAIEEGFMEVTSDGATVFTQNNEENEY